MDPSAREAEAVRALESLPWKTGALLIGGYAVAAYGPPRYSVDIDLVFPLGQLSEMQRWLTVAGYREQLTFGEGREAGKFTKLRINKGLVTGDLYFGGLRARASGAVVDYEWIAEGARERVLRLTTTSTSVPIRTVRPEGLWVLKLLAGRPQDLSDLFAIREEPLDESVVAGKLATLRAPGLSTAWNEVGQRLRSEAEYRDALSRWALGSPSSPKNVREWGRFRERVLRMLPPG
jgi:Nucleotidyl transferase AbiEii toxin, Type IV TA system